MNKKNIMPIFFYSVLFVVMFIQIILGIRWMLINFQGIPLFGDSAEYYELSNTFSIDEYRTILYPLFLHYIIRFSNHFQIGYQIPVYFIQTIISAGAIFYSTSVCIGCFLGEDKEKTLRHWLLSIYISFYIICIPMITFMNFTILTDSFALSGLIAICGALVSVMKKETLPISEMIIIGISMIVEFTVRADRLYSCSLFIIICFLIILMKKRDKKQLKGLILCFVIVLVFTIGFSKIINTKTQKPGINGRINTNFAFILLDRIVWPNMSANYTSFPEEIQNSISYEEAAEFDSHNNKVMYQLAPLVISRVGQKKADEYFITMAKIVFKNQTKKVIWDITEDFLCVIGTPISVFFHFHGGRINAAASWNVYCMSTVDESLTKFYSEYYLWTFMGLIIIGIAALIYNVLRHKEIMKRVVYNLWPYFIICLIIAAWFSFGDGAPPNDRYALIHYVTWGYMILECISGIFIKFEVEK